MNIVASIRAVRGPIAVGLLALAPITAAAGQEEEAADAPSLAGLAVPESGRSTAEWAEGWISGPASLVATEEEKDLFGRLETTGERLRFIRLFWERRDPVQRGPRNEYLDELALRVAYARENFGNEREAGWETIFGQVVVAFGVPDRERRELAAGRGVSDRPPILWSYDDEIPGLEPNEDLMFVFRAGRWRLYPPSGFGDSGVSEQQRELERQSALTDVPSDYRVAMERSVEESLANPVDYASALDRVRTTIRATDADISFSWTPRVASAEDGRHRVTIELGFRMDSLVFELGEGGFRTDMTAEVRLLGDEDVATGTGRIEIVVPETQIDARREEIVVHEIELDRPVTSGVYRLEILLQDALLGYRTSYEGEITIAS